jgi:protein SCO1/2
MIRWGIGFLLCLAAFCLAVLPAQSQPAGGGPSREHTHPSLSAGVPPESGLSIPDVLLLDQHGRKVRFYSDLVKGKVVAINFIFTTCTTICPPMGATFAKTQKLMNDRMGKDVHLISVTLDSQIDTPERLRAWAAKFNARPGWTLVTGPKPEVDRLLRALGSYVSQKEDHPPLVLIGNDSRHLWTRADGLSSAAKLVKVIDDVSQGLNTDTPQERKQP